MPVASPAQLLGRLAGTLARREHGGELYIVFEAPLALVHGQSAPRGVPATRSNAVEIPKNACSDEPRHGGF